MNKQRGAIVVEATISLSAFIFMIFTILSIVNICFIQAKIATSLGSAAKEISQYSYLYYALDIDSLDASMASGTQDSKELASKTIYGVDTFISSLSDAGSSAMSGDFDSMMDSIDTGTTSIDSLVSQYSDAIGDDPTGFIIGMGKMAGNELKEEAKVALAQVLAKTFMEKNLKSSPSDSADAFLRRYRVVDGMDGLDFNYTTFLVNGTSNLVQLVVTYKVEVIKLLNVDFAFTIRQCCKTSAWGNGISLIHPQTNGVKTNDKGETIWDMKSDTSRGELIIENERQDFDYTGSGDGFDAYNNDEGQNEFVTIITLDTHEDTYQDYKQIEYRLNRALKELEEGVEDLDEQIEVVDENGETVTVESDPDTRTYEIVLVVPDDADEETLAKAIAEFEANHPGVSVVIKRGYGSPSNPANP